METQLATDPNRFTQDLFDGLPRRYDRLAEVLSFGQNAALATGHGRPSRAVGDRPRPRRRHRHRRRRAAARRSHRRRDHRHRSHPRDAARGPRPRLGVGRVLTHCARRRQRGGAPVPRRVVRRADVHLPPPLRARPRGHHPRARASPEARRADGEPRLRRSRQPAVAVVVVVLHAAAAPGGRAARRGGLGAGRPLPRSEHQRVLRAPPGFDDRLRVGERRHGRRRQPGR